MRAVIATLMLGLGLWLFHAVSVFEGFSTARGLGPWSELMTDPSFALRFVGAISLILAGSFSLTQKWLGVVFACIGTGCFLVLVAATVLLSPDISLWRNEAVVLGAAFLLTLGLIFRK